MIKKTAKLYLVVLFFSAGLLWISLGLEASISALVVGLLCIGNILSIAFVVRQVMQKKSIALPMTLIILKYPLIAIVLVVVSKQPWIRWTGVLSAILLLITSSLVIGIREAKEKQTAELS